MQLREIARHVGNSKTDDCQRWRSQQTHCTQLLTDHAMTASGPGINSAKLTVTLVRATIRGMRLMLSLCTTMAMWCQSTLSWYGSHLLCARYRIIGSVLASAELLQTRVETL